ncbi:unnamed protein product [Cylindrotheca closterium]|uniref:Uncharacterized protein n=1 Tax=Cylindrotheca closterium TaxID=2856 RepID=A0AAD2JNY1_9STRA|nr:unnamed protein product [Cylindrotheca closterium]CAJ1968056.1 unnamed protein product [Cylindrotheca closterium]
MTTDMTILRRYSFLLDLESAKQNKTKQNNSAIVDTLSSSHPQQLRRCKCFQCHPYARRRAPPKLPMATTADHTDNR